MWNKRYVSLRQHFIRRSCKFAVLSRVFLCTLKPLSTRPRGEREKARFIEGHGKQRYGRQRFFCIEKYQGKGRKPDKSRDTVNRGTVEVLQIEVLLFILNVFSHTKLPRLVLLNIPFITLAHILHFIYFDNGYSLCQKVVSYLKNLQLDLNLFRLTRIIL